MRSGLIDVHHVGIVVPDIRSASEHYQQVLGYSPEGEICLEESQSVYVQFLRLGAQRIELIEPVGKSSPVYAFLQRGGGLNHLCYESDDLEASILWLRRSHGAVVTGPIQKSVSLEACRFAFLARPDGEVIELVELQREADA